MIANQQEAVFTSNHGIIVVKGDAAKSAQQVSDSRTYFCVLITITLLLVISSYKPVGQLHAQEKTETKVTVQKSNSDRSIKVAFGNTLPPWVLPEKDQGIIVELIKEAFQVKGYRIRAIYYPHSRRITAYKDGEVDAVCDVNESLMNVEKIDGHLSRMRYVYENKAFALKQKGYKFTRISDLTGYSVLSWQGAKEWFKGEYKEMAQSNKRYREMANIKLMVKLLYNERVDVIQMDETIFKYYRNALSMDGEIDIKKAIEIFPLFWDNEVGFLFREKEIQRLFDNAVDRLKESGRYNLIYTKYIGR